MTPSGLSRWSSADPAGAPIGKFFPYDLPYDVTAFSLTILEGTVVDRVPLFRDVTAWRGPYQGVGQRSAAAWQPYQQDTFITPPFGAYVSGHSTFSAAAAEVMKLYFGSDDFVGPKCASFEEGSSAFEQRSGSVPGVSDVPNSGKDTVGYSPRSRVTLCWDTFSAGASQASESRIYGGIHVRADADDGLALGRQIGRAVFREGNQLFRKYVDVTSVF